MQQETLQPLATTTAPDKFFFADESEQALGIETCNYDNGSVVKRVKLSDGRTAVIRELNGKDVELSTRLHEGKSEKVLMAMAMAATKINGEGVTFEELELMKAKDYNKIRMATAMLNF